MRTDLAVFAVAAGADEAAARAVLEACYRRCGHIEGALDERIVAFYEDLRAVYPGFGPAFDDSPWSSRLNPGIDHVFMNIRWSANNAVLDLIHRLAAQCGLVLYDRHDDTVYLPPS